MIQSYRELTVWKKAMDLVVESYRLTRLLPKNETYGLASQIQRAAVSIPANIAEGYGREHRGDYVHHLSIANSSLKELETHFLITERLSYIAPKVLEPFFLLSEEEGRMLHVLVKKLKTPTS